MASPQIENGHTRIANELLDAIVRVGLAGEESKVFWFIVRKTYGYQKTWDEISLSQFCLASGLNKQNTCRALSNLIKKNMIIKSDKGKITKYRIQKDYTIWKPLSKLIMLSNPIKPVINIDKESVIKSETHKRNKNTKETITKEIRTNTLVVSVDEINSIKEKWNTFASEIDLSPILDFNDDRKAKLRTRMKEKLFNMDIIIKAIRLSPHLLGESEGGWRCSFDWIIKNKTNYVKTIEGQYYSKPKLSVSEKTDADRKEWVRKKQEALDNERNKQETK